MKNNRKALLLTLCALLLVVSSVFGTFAYLTDTENAKNTFTVGQVRIDLNETDVDDDGSTKLNEYHLLPGHSYVKDPTVTVEKGSEAAYIRMLIKVENLAELKAAFTDSAYYYQGNTSGMFLLEKLCNWNTAWKMAGYKVVDGVGIYEFRYSEIVPKDEASATVLPALFTEITVPEETDNTAIAHLANVVINVEAHAMQAAGFETDEDGAWTAFDGQN